MPITLVDLIDPALSHTYWTRGAWRLYAAEGLAWWLTCEGEWWVVTIGVA